MRKILIILMMLYAYTAVAQDSTPVVPIEKQWIDSASIARDRENNTRNLNNLVHTINERSRREKQQMWLRLGFGAVLLTVGVYSLLRKKKKAK